MTPEDVEALFEKEPAAEGEALAQDRTELLRAVVGTLKGKGTSDGSGAELYLDKLANGSRNASWRTPLGESGILEFVLEAIKEAGSSMGVKTHSLRLIGNSVADTDANRETVVQADGIPALMGLLSEPCLLPYVVAVLYNLMVDYAPAQLRASNSKLSARLVDLISSSDVSTFQSQLSLICKLLKLLITQEPEPTNANPDTPLTLLKLTQNPAIAEDTEDVLSLVSTAAEYLSHAALQTPFITSGGVPTFLSVFETLHGRAYDPDNLAEEELSNQVTVDRKVLVNAIADITDNAAFADAHPIGSDVFEKIRGWLDFTNASLQAAACLSLGNLSRSDEASLALVNEHRIHIPLATALASTEDTLLLHSALSFLRNLSIPQPNRKALGPLLLRQDVLPRIWALETLPQVQLASASLTRLLAGDRENARTLIEAGGDGATRLTGVLSLFRRADDPAKMEAARVVTAVLRTLAAEPEAHQDGFYEKHPGMKDALSHLLTQQRFPVLRSETSFVLGLLVSRAPASIPTVLSLVSSREVLEVFRGAISGSLPGPADGENPLAVSEPREPKASAEEGAARADRENALVVVTRLVAALEDGREGPKADLEALLKDGGVVVRDT